jgi:uncharacterized membrane protein YgdD (TMEM256/DUF423 family)
MIKNKQLALMGSSLLVISISLGALGAHALAEILSAERLNSFLTANQYLNIHGLAFMVLALFPNYVNKAAKIVFLGLLLFSGSIFILITLGHQEIDFPKIIGLTTPIGGVLMIFGWFRMFLRIWNQESKIAP